MNLEPIVRPPIGPGEQDGLTAQVGDQVTFHDPKTKAVWKGLTVELVYTASGKASVAGNFGRSDGRGPVADDARRVSLLHCVVTRKAGEQV